jgi:hypothetical protein
MMFRHDGWTVDVIHCPAVTLEQHQTDNNAVEMIPLGGILIVSIFFNSCELYRKQYAAPS